LQSNKKTNQSHSHKQEADKQKSREAPTFRIWPE